MKIIYHKWSEFYIYALDAMSGPVCTGEGGRGPKKNPNWLKTATRLFDK